VANKALGRNIDADEQPQIFDHYEVDVKNVELDI